MDKLISTYKELIKNLDNIYIRQVYSQLETSHRIMGVVGSRGVGKTTYMLYYLKKNYGDSAKALYISADNIYFSNNKLIEVADQFVKEYSGEILCIDEIHKYPHWAQELKNIYDSYPKLKIIFSGSSSIDLIKETYDLSRRAVLRHLNGFSFREYLELKLNVKLPVLTLDEIVETRLTINSEITNTSRLLGLFKEYFKVGYYPLALELKKEEEVYESLSGLIDKIIYNDISTYYTLKTTTLPVFKQILYFIHTSTPASININKLASSLQKDNNDVANYLDMLRGSGLIRYLLIDKMGHTLIRNAEKIYLNNTNLSYAISYSIGKDIEIGSLRELFTIMNLDNSKYKVFFSKSGDIAVDKYTFEIGGSNKGGKQIEGIKDAFLIKDDELYGGAKSIPLYLFGFLY